MASATVWHHWTSLRLFSGFLEASAAWFVQLKEALKAMATGYNPLRKSSSLSSSSSSRHVTHKIKMASMRMSMDEVSKTYKITPVRR